MGGKLRGFHEDKTCYGKAGEFQEDETDEKQKKGQRRSIQELLATKIFNNTDLDSTDIKGKFAVWVGTTRWEKRPSLSLDLRWKNLHCSTRTETLLTR